MEAHLCLRIPTLGELNMSWSIRRFRNLAVDRSRALVISLLLAATPIAAFGQDPVVKPRTTATDRLVAPRNVTAVQEPDGRIRVTWSPVERATSYAIVRSVPPDPAKVIDPGFADTVFFDSDVVAGKTYYYVISGLNDITTGLRAGSVGLKALKSAGPAGALAPPTNVVAKYNQAFHSVTLSWEAAPELTFLVESRVLPSGPWEALSRTRSRGMNMTPPTTAGRAQFRVTSEDAFGARSQPALSNEIVVDASTATGSGSLVVTMGAPISVRVGATASAVFAAAAGASRWISLDEPVATVDASGTVTGRTTGATQILAIGRGSDALVRVTLIQVRVTP